MFLLKVRLVLGGLCVWTGKELAALLIPWVRFWVRLLGRAAGKELPKLPRLVPT